MLVSLTKMPYMTLDWLSKQKVVYIYHIYFKVQYWQNISTHIPVNSQSLICDVVSCCGDIHIYYISKLLLFKVIYLIWIRE